MIILRLIGLIGKIMVLSWSMYATWHILDPRDPIHEV